MTAPLPVHAEALRGWRLPVGQTLRIAVGPLAAAAFFLSWGHGAGPFAANEFSGFELVAFAGRLQQLDLSVVEGGALFGVRLLIVGVVIAAAWQAVLAPAHRWHPGYGASGWYLASAAGIALLIGFARAGLAVPPPGLLLLTIAGGLFASCSIAGQRRLRRDH